MPRPGPRKIPITVKLTIDQVAALQAMADRLTYGNKSELIRYLVTQATQPRNEET